MSCRNHFNFNNNYKKCMLFFIFTISKTINENNLVLCFQTLDSKKKKIMNF